MSRQKYPCERKVSFGSVSTGTARNCDLIPALWDTLAYYAPREARRLAKEFVNVNPYCEETCRTDEADYYVEALFDSLNMVACRLPFCYFGACEGSSTDYGFWCSLEFDELDDDVLYWRDETRNPTRDELTGYSYYLRVNERGNATLFNRTHKEVWTLV